MSFPSDFIQPARQTGSNCFMWEARCHYCGRDLISPFSSAICSFLGRHLDDISPGALASMALKQSLSKAKIRGLFYLKQSWSDRDKYKMINIIPKSTTVLKLIQQHTTHNAPLSSTGPGLITCYLCDLEHIKYSPGISVFSVKKKMSTIIFTSLRCQCKSPHLDTSINNLLFRGMRKMWN